MSHLDDLDEYEAELELALKREYQAVFALFRFCVLTQDATYLCNPLAGQPAAPPAAGGLPFFQLELEDVWVWDKNRPTRIIPRAKVFTSGDVTVEELRGDGDEPQLTAEALAERIGEPFRLEDGYPPRRDAARGRRRKHADGLRALRRAGARRALADRHGGAPDRRRARSAPCGLP